MAIGQVTPVTIDKVGMAVVLHKLARRPGRSRDLYAKLMGSWGQRPDRERATVKLTESDMQELNALKLPNGTVRQDVLPSGYLGVYQHPRKPQLEVTVHSTTKPPKRRTFRVGKRKYQLVRVAISKVGTNPQKEASMAKATTRSKKKVVDEDELEGLEGLEDLEDLDDEELEEDEPEDVDEEEDEEEDEEPAPKRGRAKSKKAPAKGKAKSAAKGKAKAEPEEEEDEEEEDEAPRKRSTKTQGKAKSSKASKTSKGESKSKAKANGKGGNLPTTQALPKGQAGPREIAEMVGGNCDDRYVRIWLRENRDRPDGGRWGFGKQEARTIAKEIKAKRRKEVSE